MSSASYRRTIEIISLAKQAFGKYKLSVVVLTILGFFSGLLEAVGVNALIPLISFITGGGGKGDDIISQTIEKLFSFVGLDFTFKFLLIFIVSLFVAKAIVIIATAYIKIKITTDYENNLRNNLFRKTLKADWSYLLKQKLGHLNTVLSIDITQGSVLLDQISGGIIILTSLFIYILVAINISFEVTLLTLAFGGFAFLIFKPLIYRTKIMAGQVVNMNKKIAHHVNENIFGMKTVKSVVVSNSVGKVAQDLFENLRELKVKILMLRNITNALFQPISLIFISILFAYSYKTANFSFAALIALVYLIQRIFQYFQQMQSLLHRMNESAPYLRDVLRYEESATKNVEKNIGAKPFMFEKSLEFKDVEFAYNRQKTVLSNVDFTIKKGEMVGLIGPSGGGKTTIFDLILRLFNPVAGKILLDGRDVSEIDIDEWRRAIGYVSQDMFIMNDTIENNIRFYDDTISGKDMMGAAKMANIDDFIQSCADRFSTIVGERGVLLSAGQRQRIIIARILARKPKLLILDEATSALDSESELKIQETIEGLKGKVTVLVIAHRLSTVINSDKLLVLENGEITEQGTPAELLEKKTSYFHKTYNIRK